MRAPTKQLDKVLTGAARSCCTTRHRTCRKRFCRHFYGWVRGSRSCIGPASIQRNLTFGCCISAYIGSYTVQRQTEATSAQYVACCTCCVFWPARDCAVILAFSPRVSLEMNPGATVVPPARCLQLVILSSTSTSSFTGFCPDSMPPFPSTVVDGSSRDPGCLHHLPAVSFRKQPTYHSPANAFAAQNHDCEAVTKTGAVLSISPHAVRSLEPRCFWPG